MATYRISIVGTGYVGLCTAAGFASKGYEVIASTRDSEKASLVNLGIPPFYEPGLEGLLKKVVDKGNLRCVVGREEAILDTDITFIAVATPSNPDGSINLQHIADSAQDIGEVLSKKGAYHLIVVKSTVVPGTTQNLVKSALEKFSNARCGLDFGLCMNPEFLREGSAVHDTFHPDRIVIGEYDRKSGDILEALYKDFYSNGVPPIVRTNLPTAELIKYASNSFLATKISFVSQIANLCQKIPGADVVKVAEAVGLDHRIGSHFLKAGLGYGGSCFPKDVKALISYSEGLGYSPVLLKAVEAVNEAQPLQALSLAKRLMSDVKGKRIAILGLAFKPNTDDIREAVSIKLIEALLKEGARIVAYDPAAMVNVKRVLGDRIEYASSAIECICGSDGCIIATEWDEFKNLKAEDFIENMATPTLIDGRRIYDPETFGRKMRFAAIGLGNENSLKHSNEAC